MAVTSNEDRRRIVRRVSTGRRGDVSVVRTHAPGVTVLPSAEGPSLRSDPRWTARRAHRSERLLQRLVARRRRRTAR